MLCPRCSTPVPVGNKYCTECGYKIVQTTDELASFKQQSQSKSVPATIQSQDSLVSANVQKRFWNKTWFAWLMLFVFWPIGIFLLWKNQLYGKLPRIVITVLFCLIGLTSWFMPSQKTAPTVSPVPNQSISQDDQVNEPIVKTDSLKEAEKGQLPIETTNQEQAKVPSKPEAKPVVKQPAVIKPNNYRSQGYVASRNSKKFHYETCGAVAKIKANNLIYLNSRAEAVGRGYQPCARCKP